MEEKDDEFLKMLGSKGTKQILDFIHEHGTAQYRDFQLFMNVNTLNNRLKKLLRLGILEHHLEREEKRREWYTLTDKGKKLVKLLEEIVASMD
ncbi:MAG: winged helix-turn-helix transcriptional regulator [Theionarchaea archaeon]|nr:winged helix-turn-helix transcriptional regulator [Theionarchaea archaeon]